jgi:hypothetical protein
LVRKHLATPLSVGVAPANWHGMMLVAATLVGMIALGPWVLE